MNLDKIDLFAKNRLSESDTDQFMHELVHKMANHEQRLKWEQQLETQFNVTRADQIGKPGMSVRGMWRLAAAIALLLVVGAGVLISIQKPEYQRLADAYMRQDKLEYADFRKGVSDLTELRAKAVDAYTRADYGQSIQHWITLKKSAEFNADDQFFLALSYCYDKQFEAAVVAFDQHAALSKTDGRFVQERLYYQAIALLELNRIDEARNRLLTLQANTQSPVLIQKARDLLETMPK